MGFFPAAWTGDVGGAIRRVRDEVGALLPVLMQPRQPVTVAPAASDVRAAAWVSGGVVYVAAVNAGTAATDVTLEVPALRGRNVTALGESAQVRTSGAAIDDRLAPLQVRLYVATQ